MSSPSIDYNALAKQAGAIDSTPSSGGVDYAALAKQAGATSSEPAAAQPPAASKPAQPPGVLSRIGSGILDITVRGFTHPIDTLISMGKQAIGKDDLDAIHDAVKSGDYKGAAAHAVKWVMGRTPEGAALQAGYNQVAPTIESLKKGDYATATGRAIGTGVSIGLAALTGGKTAPASGAEAAVSTLPEDAAAAQTAKLSAATEKTPWGSLDDVRKAADAGDAHAQEVTKQIDNSVNDPGRTMQASLNLSDWRTAQQSNQLYGKVADLAENKYKLGNVPLPGTQKALSQAIDELKVAKDVEAAKPALKVLSGIQDQLAAKPAPPPGPVPTNIQDFTNWKNAAAKTTPANNSYGLVRDLVSDLGERIRTQQTGDNALIGPKQIVKLQQVKDALESDLSGFVDKSGIPELKQAAGDADSYYRAVRTMFKDPGIAKAASTGEPDTVFQSLVKAGRGDKAQKFYDALDPKGQAAVQQQLLTKTVSDATDPVKGFDSAKFVKSMDNLKDAYGVFFRGKDETAMTGLRNLVLHAAKVDANPSAYAVNALPVVGKLAPSGPGKFSAAVNAIPSVGSSIERWSKVLLSTPEGRQLLYSAGQLKPTSPLLPSLLKKATAMTASSNTPQDQQ